MPERQVITSLNGVAAPLLTTDVSDRTKIDLWSLWLPRPWARTTPFVIDELTYDCCGSNQSWSTRCFEIAKSSHIIRDLCLHIVMPPHTNTNDQPPPVGNVLTEFVDHLGYALIREFTIMFGSNTVYNRQNYDMYFYYRKAFTDEQRNAINYLIRGDLSTAQRQIDFRNGVEMFIDMFLPFEMSDSQALPLVCLSQKMRLELVVEDLDNLVHTQLAPPPFVKNGLPTTVGQYRIDLIVKHVHTTGAEGDFLLSMSRDGRGLSYLMGQNVRQVSRFPGQLTNATNVEIALTGMTKPLRYIFWALIPENIAVNNGFKDMFFFQPQPVLGPIPPAMTSYTPILSWEIISNGQIIQRNVLRDYNRVRDHYKYFPASHGDEIFQQLYTDFPLAVNACRGLLDYTNLNNPRLIIHPSPTGFGLDAITPVNPQSMYMIMNALDYNFWFFKSGNWSRTFN